MGKTRRRRPLWHSFLAARLPITLALLAVSSAAYFTVRNEPRLPTVHSGGTTSSQTAFHRPGCDIKGNINERGERIYHMPGQEYYSATRVNQARGERWFCSQWEAWWAGWRKYIGDGDSARRRPASAMAMDNLTARVPS